MKWSLARDLARKGTPIRRAAWVDRWLNFSEALWWIMPFDAATGISGAPHVVRATDFTSAEFLATDWTTDAISIAVIESMSVAVDVSASACVFLAYAPAGYVSAAYPRDGVANCSPVSVVIPAAASRLTLSATGTWCWSDYTAGSSGPAGLSPDGSTTPCTVNASYLNALAGSDHMPNPLLNGQALVGHWKTAAGDGAVFELGAGVTDLAIPDGVRTLVLGMVDGYEWFNNVGSAHVQIDFSA